MLAMYCLEILSVIILVWKTNDILLNSWKVWISVDQEIRYKDNYKYSFEK